MTEANQTPSSRRYVCIYNVMGGADGKGEVWTEMVWKGTKLFGSIIYSIKIKPNVVNEMSSSLVVDRVTIIQRFQLMAIKKAAFF